MFDSDVAVPASRPENSRRLESCHMYRVRAYAFMDVKDDICVLVSECALHTPDATLNSHILNLFPPVLFPLQIFSLYQQHSIHTPVILTIIRHLRPPTPNHLSTRRNKSQLRHVNFQNRPLRQHA